MYNNRGPQDTRFALTGKDAALYNGDGVLLATVENFQVQVNVTNGTYQPLGDAQEHDVLQSYKVTLTASQITIEDDYLIQDVFNMMHEGQQPDWTFQGVVYGRNGSAQRMNYRGCVPAGNIDLQNASVGDIIKRAWNMTVNDPPELQSLLNAA